jgi:hypothetical protein
MIGLTSSDTDFVFAKPGETYAIYLPDGRSPELDLAGVNGTFELKWYDNRKGGALQDRSVHTVEGGGKRNLGSAPKDKAMDWASAPNWSSFEEYR